MKGGDAFEKEKAVIALSLHRDADEYAPDVRGRCNHPARRYCSKKPVGKPIKGFGRRT
jgi:hypothetical protein